MAAYIGTNWVHIFPWLKDYSIVEGLDLYDYMPTNYSSAYGWVKDYIYGNTIFCPWPWTATRRRE